MVNVNDFKFWEDIYLNNDTGWDLGDPTPVFIEISKQIKPGKLIILGCGRGYDAVMFAKKGFEVTAVDFSPSAVNFLSNLSNKNKVKVNIIQEDLFILNERYINHFDYVIEQTCFCAIDPNRRIEYEKLVRTIIKVNGSLIGLWFPLGKRIKEGGPPWGVSEFEVKSIFKNNWIIKKEENPVLSVKKRKNREKLIIFKKINK